MAQEAGDARQSAPSPRAPGPEECLSLEVFGWNLGGSAWDCFRQSLAENMGGGVDREMIGLLQECPRGKAGWSTHTESGFVSLVHRRSSQWRGVGMWYHPSVWAVLFKRGSGLGMWVKAKHLPSGNIVLFGSLHLTPGLTLGTYEEELDLFFSGKPKGVKRVVFQADVNAAFSWSQSDTGDSPCAKDGKATLVLDRLRQEGLQPVAPIRAHQQLPTSRPRQDGRQGSRIDIFATCGLLHSSLRVKEGSCFSIGTDHELLCAHFAVRGARVFTRPATGPRIWTGELKQVDEITQETLTTLAKLHTNPKPPRAYQDPPAVKQACKDAKVSGSKESWKRVLQLRREARRKWESDRVHRASQCDWSAFKDLRQKGQGSWDLHFAEHQCRDPHTVVEEHFAAIYKGEPLNLNVDCPSECEAFTVVEIQEAVGQMKGGKSVGLDLTSKELFQGILKAPGGAEHLAEFFTRVLSTGVVPSDWTKSIMIILAKVPLPVVPKELRPIALGSSASKLYSRLVLNRSMQFLGAKGPSQCAQKHRQTCDYVFSLWRIMELCREWGRPLVCV